MGFAKKIAENAEKERSTVFVVRSDKYISLTVGKVPAFVAGVVEQFL